MFKESKNLESLGALVDFLTGEEFVRGQLETNYSITAIPELNRKFAPNEQVKSMSNDAFALPRYGFASAAGIFYGLATFVIALVMAALIRFWRRRAGT